MALWKRKDLIPKFLNLILHHHHHRQALHFHFNHFIQRILTNVSSDPFHLKLLASQKKMRNSLHSQIKAFHYRGHCQFSLSFTLNFIHYLFSFCLKIVFFPAEKYINKKIIKFFSKQCLISKKKNFYSNYPHFLWTSNLFLKIKTYKERYSKMSFVH